jgi:hypothetical protein
MKSSTWLAVGSVTVSPCAKAIALGIPTSFERKFD